MGRTQTQALLMAALAVLTLHRCRAHVSLTFPPARLPNYDFLDNVRTGGPCGVPESNSSVVTTFQSGATFDVIYHLGYAHQGGIVVNLLSSNGTILYALLGLQWQNTNDSTRNTWEVTLPADFECDRCTLQLVRQAREWGTATGSYLFWSCADISIVNSTEALCNNMTCSGNGNCSAGVCQCDRLYSGDFCQFKDECENSSDCSNQGSCIDVKSTSFPRKQCFCNAGWQGEACSRQSSLTDATIDPSKYTIKRRLNRKLTMYAKVDGDELEIAFRHDGTSYVALGWRPRGLTGDCRASAPGNFPIGSHMLWPNGTTWPSLVEDLNVTAFYAQLTAGGGAPEGGAEEGAPEEGAPEEGATPIHPMDCTDLVVAMVRGNQIRIYDYYTRDRSTPRMDSFYGGVQSLTGAVGKEENGITTVIWRKNLTGDGSADHDIVDSLMHVIWSFGQVKGDYFHRPFSAIEAGTAGNLMFYQPDELKYHGTHNRGAITLNFFEEDSAPAAGCKGKFETGCDAGGICDYSASWTVQPVTRTVNFTVSARRIPTLVGAQWVAIGFSPDRFMPNSDAVVGAADANGFFVTDRFITVRASPPVDASNDITDAVAMFDNGVTTMKFTRPLDSRDEEDFSLSECRYFLYGWGGMADVAAQTVSYHPSTPIVSTDMICLQQCEGSPATIGSILVICLTMLLSLAAIM